MERGWVPHQPECWPFHYATLSRPVTMSVYRGYWEDGEPAMDTYEVPAGTVLRIVMASRFGDVGVTDRLEDETGYGARVSPDELTPATTYHTVGGS